MGNRFCCAAALGMLILAASPALAQKAATDRKAPPKPKPQGAWWYTGDAPPATPGPPDLTGVWFSGASGDLSKSTLPGQEMILTPFGKQRYDTVDLAKDPDTFCLPQGPGRQLMSVHPMMVIQR